MGASGLLLAPQSGERGAELLVADRWTYVHGQKIAPIENPTLQRGDVVRLDDRKPAERSDGVPPADHLGTFGWLTSGLEKSINRGFAKFGTTGPAYEE